MPSLTTKKIIKRKIASKKIINRRMLYATGLGLIPIPAVDAAGILGIQVVMIKDIAKIYQIPFKEHRIKSLLGSLIGSVGTFGAIKAIPGVGSIIGGAAVSISAAASTYAIGHLFAQHFAQGGTLLNFDPVKSRLYFQELYEEGVIKSDKLNTSKSASSSTILKRKQANTNKTDPALAKAKRVKELKAKRKKLLKAKKRKSFIRKIIA